MAGDTDRPIPPVLTTLQIKTAKRAGRACKLADTGGLSVLVQPKGSELWRCKFRLVGVEGLQALGAFPEATLADARHAHAESRKLVAKGVRPIQARRDKRESRAQAELHRVKGSFGAGRTDWSAATGADLRPAMVLQRNRENEKDLTPRFKDRPILKITRLELTAALKEVEARAPEVASNLRNDLWGIFEYAIDTGLAADNPVDRNAARHVDGLSQGRSHRQQLERDRPESSRVGNPRRPDEGWPRPTGAALPSVREAAAGTAGARPRQQRLLVPRSNRSRSADGRSKPRCTDGAAVDRQPRAGHEVVRGALAQLGEKPNTS